jgi:hypothetical protein
MQLEELMGKTALDVVKTLPELEWSLCRGIPQIPNPTAHLQQLTFVNYENRRSRAQRREYDLFVNVPADDVDVYFKQCGCYSTGLISRVVAQVQSMEMPAHIPMLDFDLQALSSNLAEREAIAILRDKIRSELELTSGLFLRSSDKQNYHFLGAGQLLPDAAFAVFLGQAGLKMEYALPSGEHTPLVDHRHIFHSLSPMACLAQTEDEEEGRRQWSIYDRPVQFATLRMTKREVSARPPYVIALL